MGDILLGETEKPKRFLRFSCFTDIIRQYTNTRVLAIGCIAYASGLPLLLTSKTLGVWLETYGLTYTSIGLFGLLHIPYTCKFLWAPILDQVPLPFLSKFLGQRRSWLCFTQLTAMAGLFGMAFLDPLLNMYAFVACGLLATISSASQHILLLTYQMESLSAENWGIGEGMGVFTYRMAILTGGAGALYLASFLSWQEVYFFLSFLIVVGLVAVLFMEEPEKVRKNHFRSFAKYRDWFKHAFFSPLKDFMLQKGWQAILLFMFLYRMPENLFGMMQTLFLLDLGFTYIEVSSAAKVFGLGATILGGFFGGYFIRLYGYKKTLYWSALAHCVSSLLFIGQAQVGANLPFLYMTIGIEHFFSGMALTGFFSYQLTCCTLSFAATQLALLTSLAALSRTLTSPIAGKLIDSFGWEPFLIVVTLSSIPGIWLVKKIPFSRP
ncbi:MAG: MFS transporter [Proteobacteria bacterium]|nr:MFS transporter [Pseudomonadota bacterium]